MNRRPPDSSDKPNGTTDFFGDSFFRGFDDPFFRHFDEINREMNEMFTNVFGGSIPQMPQDREDNERPPRMGIEGPTIHPRQGDDYRRPHLSLINPEIIPPLENGSSDDNENSRTVRPYERTDQSNNFEHSDRRWWLFDHLRNLFEPEYCGPRIGNINPDYAQENNKIFDDNDNDQHQGATDPGRHTPKLPSPYLPNWQGSEVDIPTNSYYRSQSTIITTSPDGQTKKVTTTTDSSGRTETVEEVFDTNHTDTPPRDGGAGIFSFPLPWGNGSVFRDRTKDMPKREEIVNNDQTHRENKESWRSWFQRKIHRNRNVSDHSNSGNDKEWFWGHKIKQRNTEQEK